MSGMILGGTYYPDGTKPPTVIMNSQYKIWSMDDQRKEHAKDILQAHKGGLPNPEFIREYPEEASHYFTPDQIKEHGNEY